MQSLKSYNTFDLAAVCKTIIPIYFEEELNGLFETIGKHKILGGGSNVLLTKDFPDTSFVINQIKGIKIVFEDKDFVEVQVGGGEYWHQFVMWAVSHDLGGIENMALIPGTVGAAPIQNIGAYGTEQKELFVSLRAYNKSTGELQIFDKQMCKFGYRDSIFKNEAADQYFIVSVNYKLNKNSIVNTNYRDVEQYLMENSISKPRVKDVARAVIAIRTAKLPDPEIIGNAGSFFKNPIVPNEKIYALKMDYPDMPSYPSSETHGKLAAGWLIDQCGFKGRKVGNTGTYRNQALVIVNHGEANGKEIQEFSILIQKSVLDKFGVAIEAEVNIW